MEKQLYTKGNIVGFILSNVPIDDAHRFIHDKIIGLNHKGSTRSGIFKNASWNGQEPLSTLEDTEFNEEIVTRTSACRLTFDAQFNGVPYVLSVITADGFYNIRQKPQFGHWDFSAKRYDNKKPHGGLVEKIEKTIKEYNPSGLVL